MSYDAALMAGVSQAAVSRCFRPGGSIAPETRALVEQAGLTRAVAGGAFDHGSGEQNFQRLMAQSGNSLDAVICANHLMAIDAAREVYGRDVPRDVSVVNSMGWGWRPGPATA